MSHPLIAVMVEGVVRPSEQRKDLLRVRQGSEHAEANLRDRKYEAGTEQTGAVLTSAPVQNMGHLLHGSSRAFCNHVLRYGFLTMSGSTGGWRVEAPTTLARSAAVVTLRDRIASINGAHAHANRRVKARERKSLAISTVNTRSCDV